MNAGYGYAKPANGPQQEQPATNPQGDRKVSDLSQRLRERTWLSEDAICGEAAGWIETLEALTDQLAEALRWVSMGVASPVGVDITAPARAAIDAWWADKKSHR